MKAGGLPARRPDQHTSATPRSTAPGSRLVQIANNKGLPVTVQIINDPSEPVDTQIINNPTKPVNVQIINNPTQPVVTESGGIPGLVSAEALQVNANASPDVFLTFPSAGRIWGAHLSFAASTGSAYSSGIAQLYSQIMLPVSGRSIAVVELSIGGPSQAVNGDADPNVNGLAVAAHETVELDVNNAVSLGTGGAMRASAIVLYSVP